MKKILLRVRKKKNIPQNTKSHVKIKKAEVVAKLPPL
jgi:hypothetical protein